MLFSKAISFCIFLLNTFNEISIIWIAISYLSPILILSLVLVSSVCVYLLFIHKKPIIIGDIVINDNMKRGMYIYYYYSVCVYVVIYYNN